MIWEWSHHLENILLRCVVDEWQYGRRLVILHSGEEKSHCFLKQHKFRGHQKPTRSMTRAGIARDQRSGSNLTVGKDRRAMGEMCKKKRDGCWTSSMTELLSLVNMVMPGGVLE